MATSLPTDVDASFSDDGSPSRKVHQQHHDAVHAYTNTHDGAADPHGDRAYADGKFLAKADNLAALTDKAVARTNLDVHSKAESSAAFAAKAGATFTGQVGFDVGLVSARMRQAERFTGVAETTTGLAYAGLPTATEVDFVVPPSERGMVHLRADISNSGADFSFMGFDIFDVAGAAITQLPSDDAAVYQQGTSRAMDGIAVPVVFPAGSAGKTFRLRARSRVTGGTGTFSRRQVTFVPSP